MIFLGVDIGTSSVKLGAIDERGAFLGWADATYALTHPQPGWAEVPARAYTDAFLSALTKLGATVDLSKIDAVSFSSQGQTFAPIDENGSALQNAWTWLDARSANEATAINAAMSDAAVFSHTGQDATSAGHFVSMASHLAKTNAPVVNRAWSLAHVTTLLIHWLTGRSAWDINNATMAMVADVSTRAYWSEMLRTAGIDARKLPEIVDSGAVIGEVVREGLPIRRGVRVVAGANDQTANAIGAGLDGPEKVVLVLGTALIAFRLLPGTTLPSDDGYHGICSVYPVPNTLYQLGFTNTGCGALDWARSVLAESVSYEAIFDRVATIPIGCEGVTMLIDLDGVGWPNNPNYRASWAGLSRKSDRWTMLRATIEGICFSQRELIESMRWDVRGRTVRAVGGAMRSPIWAQMLCDVLGVPLERLGHEQSGVVGASMMAAVGVGAFGDYAEATSHVVQVAGRYEPDARRHAEYQKAYDRYLQLRGAMQTFYV